MLRYALMVVIGVVALGCVLWYTASDTPYAEAATIAEGAREFKDLEGRFRDLARERGGVYAFEVLRRATLPPNTDLHLLGHAVGEVLYEQKGVDGIADCTQDFRNACSHSIVVGALNEYGGEAALGLIRDACTKAPGGSGAYTMCYHGLGHGVFAYFAYDIAQTVDFCRKTGTEEYENEEYIECVGGMIMELQSGGGHNQEAWLAAREKYLDGPLAPCINAVIPEDVKPMCFTYLTPQMWTYAGISMGSPEPWKFAEAFAYCDAIPRTRQKLRDACYGGFGKEFLPLTVGRDIRSNVTYSDEQLLATLSWCSYAGAAENRAPCVRSALAAAFWGGEKDPATSFRMCELADRDQAPCYIHLAENIDRYIEGERRAELCGRLPEKYRERCSI